MQGLLAQAQAMQQQLAQAQEELASAEVTGSAGGDLVTVTLTGTGEMTAIDIKPEAADPEDTESLGDLIIAAYRDAQAKTQQLAEEKLGPVAGGLGGGPAGGGPAGGGPFGGGLPGLPG
ncbi:hypothetical protein GGQ54_001888 [Naumannella cuiyingiana]|uniref:Nucleoid-associated protein GGQ54_001888 n=2 Tax=Naumannella cuiyingiana TaxID=1347891 RepID=A0A7Z0IL83_9ACTN|nr:hypothetical protein [Naumannella cuiyingiana]